MSTAPSQVAPHVAACLAEVHRESWGRVLAAVARTVGGDLDVAEDATQEAFVGALEAWARDGVPSRPAAWLTTAARRKALDRLRRDATLRRKLPLLLEPDGEARPDDGLPDELLALVLTCCHPAFAPDARVALTLRLVCGLTTAEIARAFLVAEPTMAARLTRAKKKAAAARIPLHVPSREELPERLDGVLDVVYLLFTTGHTAPSGEDLVRRDLVARAKDLGELLAVLLPRSAEVLGLLALLDLTDARSPARLDAAGVPVPLEEQDRSRWDGGGTARGLRTLERARGLLGDQPPGRFLLQAQIAAVHLRAPSWESTDWDLLLRLHDALSAVWPSPVVRLNRAAALGLARGPEVGLAELDAVATDARLASYPYLPAARADLLRRAGRVEEAVAHYRAAVALTRNEGERAYLRRRLAELGEPDGTAAGRGTA